MRAPPTPGSRPRLRTGHDRRSAPPPCGVRPAPVPRPTPARPAARPVPPPSRARRARPRQPASALLSHGRAPRPSRALAPLHPGVRRYEPLSPAMSQESPGWRHRAHRAAEISPPARLRCSVCPPALLPAGRPAGHAPRSRPSRTPGRRASRPPAPWSPPGQDRLFVVRAEMGIGEGKPDHKGRCSRGG